MQYSLGIKTFYILLYLNAYFMIRINKLGLKEKIYTSSCRFLSNKSLPKPTM